jgi:hypothetical protein
MIKGVNIDFTNHPPQPSELVDMGCDAVRFPSRPGVDPQINDMHIFGIRTMAVIDQNAAGYICGGGSCSWYQLDNEVDIRGVPTAQYASDIVLYKDTYPNLRWIAAGMAAGDYNATYLREVVGALRDKNFGAFAIHPYAKTPTAAASLLTATRKVDPSFPIFYTECHPEAGDIRQFYKSAVDAGCAGVFYHCWTDWMTLASEGLRFGLIDENNNHKREYDLWASI